MSTTFLEPGTDATQDFSFFSATGGTISSDSTKAYTGGRSIKGFTNNPAATAFANSPAATLVQAGGRIAFKFLFDTIPAVASSFQVGFTSGLATVWTIQLRADGIIQIVPTGATTAVGTTVLAINKWYVISVVYTITNSTTYTIKVFLNGVLEVTANAGTLTNVAVDRARWQAGGGIGINASCWFDDLYMDNDTSLTDPGNIRVTSKRPFANGTTNGFTTQIGAGGSGYGTGHAPQVNEQPLSQTNGWSMVGAGAAITEEYNIEGIAVGDVPIQSDIIVDVCGWVFAKSLSSETGQIILNNITSNISLTSTPTLFPVFAGSSIYPAGAGKDIGIITTTALTTVSLYECGVIVAYKNASLLNMFR